MNSSFSLISQFEQLVLMAPRAQSIHKTQRRSAPFIVRPEQTTASNITAQRNFHPDEGRYRPLPSPPIQDANHQVHEGETTTPGSGDFLPDGRNDTRRKVGPTIWIILVRPPGWVQDDRSVSWTRTVGVLFYSRRLSCNSVRCHVSGNCDSRVQPLCIFVDHNTETTTCCGMIPAHGHELPRTL